MPGYRPHHAFPRVSLRPQCGAHLVSLTRTGIGPQTHRNMIPATLPSALFSYFCFDTLFSIPLQNLTTGIQSKVAVLAPLIIFRVPSAVSRVCCLQGRLPVSGEASGAQAQAPSSVATRRLSGSPAGSPPASALGCRSRCRRRAARCFLRAPPCASGQSSTE